jgi:hypothetical protein
MEMSGQVHVPTALTSGKCPWYLADMLAERERERESLSGDCAEERKLLTLNAIEPRFFRHL